MPETIPKAWKELAPPKRDILICLYLETDPLTGRELVSQTGWTEATISENLGALEDADLITREVAAKAGNPRQNELTPKGATLVELVYGQ